MIIRCEIVGGASFEFADDDAQELYDNFLQYYGTEEELNNENISISIHNKTIKERQV